MKNPNKKENILACTELFFIPSVPIYLTQMRFFYYFYYHQQTLFDAGTHTHFILNSDTKIWINFSKIICFVCFLYPFSFFCWSYPFYVLLAKFPIPIKVLYQKIQKSNDRCKLCVSICLISCVFVYMWGSAFVCVYDDISKQLFFLCFLYFHLFHVYGGKLPCKDNKIMRCVNKELDFSEFVTARERH